jgi:hypothetical protein
MYYGDHMQSVNCLMQCAVKIEMIRSWYRFFPKKQVNADNRRFNQHYCRLNELIRKLFVCTDIFKMNTIGLNYLQTCKMYTCSNMLLMEPKCMLPRYQRASVETIKLTNNVLITNFCSVTCFKYETLPVGYLYADQLLNLARKFCVQ